ncbi:MAG: VWA domain-containing protein [bacterium]|nr:VWA domain-containing protein [bacterium]
MNTNRRLFRHFILLFILIIAVAALGCGTMGGLIKGSSSGDDDSASEGNFEEIKTAERDESGRDRDLKKRETEKTGRKRPPKGDKTIKDLLLNKDKERGASGGKIDMAETENGTGGPPEESGLKAGYVDDNKQYNRFVKFLEKYKGQAPHLPINIRERIILKVKDKNNKPVSNALVKISTGNKKLFTGKTYADGSCFFYPSRYSGGMSQYSAAVRYNQAAKTIKFNRFGKRTVPIKMALTRAAMKRVPLDILFIFDTTGSMGEEILRLKQTIEIIYLNLSSLSTKPKVRLGMVLYKDVGDEYVTQVVPFTPSLEKFKNRLDEVYASGGGDEPEDLQAALRDSIKKMKWNRNGIRMGFIVTDAPPHLDYRQKYTYKNAVRDARKDAIKICSIGTGGLNIKGEYVLRQVAQQTYGKYIFLTYGEKGESHGGRPGSVSHHTGANFQTGKLEAIIIRFAKKELSYLTDEPIEDGKGYFQAKKVDYEEKKATVNKLFGMAIDQLVDYSSISIKKGTGVAVLPFTTAGKTKNEKVNAEYFTEQMIFALSKNRVFTMVERKNLQKILEEISIRMSGLVEEKNISKVGKMMGAKMLITGQLYKKRGQYELFVKLLRVETGEVLAVTRAKIDVSLGL